MAEKLTPSQIRELYNAIAEADRTLPSFEEVDFETKWMVIELNRRLALGITEEQGADEGKSIEEYIQEIYTELEAKYRVYDQAGFFEGKPTEEQILYRYIACRRINVPQNFTGSIAKCIIAPTGNYIITILRGEDEIGTITFSAGLTIGVFTSLGAFTLDIGDTLTFKAPAVADNTFETLIFNLKLMWSE